MKHYTHLIWDFNGTLLDDVAYDVSVTNRLLERHGLPKLPSADAYRAVFGFPVIHYYQRLGFDFSNLPFSVLADEWMSDYNSQREQAPLFPQVPQLLAAVRAAGVPQILLSATQRQMLLSQLQMLGISNAFDEIIGADNHHAYGKEDLARRWKSEHPEAVPLMVGDTDHDAESARAMGADILLVTCGHQSREKLEALHPLAVYAQATDIPFAHYFPQMGKKS